MSEMVPTGSKWTDQDRLQAIAAYGAYGTFMAVERELGIPNNTVCNWSKTEWWLDGVAKVREENQNEHISQYNRLTKKALDKAEQGIDQLGDDLSAGDIKALVVTGATATDKARLLLNQPTSISGKSEGMAELAAQFRQLSADHKAIQDTVVSTQDGG